MPPKEHMRKPRTNTGQGIHSRVDTRPQNGKRAMPDGDHSLPSLMDVRTPLVFSHPPTTRAKRRDNHRYDNVGDKNEERRNEQQVPTDTTTLGDKNEERWNEHQIPWNEHQVQIIKSEFKSE